MDTDRLDTEIPLTANNKNQEDELDLREGVQEIFSVDHKYQKQGSQKTSTNKESQEQLGSHEQTSSKSKQSKKQNYIDTSIKNIGLEYGDKQKIQKLDSISNQSSKQDHQQEASMFNIFMKGNFKDHENHKNNQDQINENKQEPIFKNKYNNEDFRLIDLDQIQNEDLTTGSPQFQMKNMNFENDETKNENDEPSEFDIQQFKIQVQKNQGNNNIDQQSQFNESEFLEYDGIEIKKIEIPKKTLQKSGIARYIENSLFNKGSNRESLQEDKFQDKNSTTKSVQQKTSLVNAEKCKQVEYIIKEPVKTQAIQNSKQQLFQDQKTSYQHNILNMKNDIKGKNLMQIKLNLLKEESNEDNISNNIRKSSLSEENQKNKFIKYKKIKLVRKMIKIFEKYNIIKRFVNVPAYYFRFLGDKASFFKQKNDDQNIIEKLKKKIVKFQSFDQEQEEKISRLILFQDIAFTQSLQPEQKFDTIFTLIPSILFLIDIYINFNLAFYLNGKLVVDRRQIALNYFFGYYWFDFIALALQISLDKSIPTLIYRLYQIKFELERLLSSFQIQVKYYYSYRVIRLVMELILSSHILACVFILAAAYSPSDDNWIYSNNLQNQPNKIIYLNSLYYIVVTVATIGYGDIHPVSSTEKMFLIFIAFITTGLFAYNVSTISSIVNDIVRKKLQTKRQILGLTQYMTERNISRQVQNQILEQLYYNMKTEKSSSTIIDKCLQHVSENLKGSLFNEYFGNILDTNKYFKRKFSKQFLKSIIPKFKEEVYSPGETLFAQGDTQQKLIYLRKGEVVLYLTQCDPVPIVQEYKENNWIGYEDFFTGAPKNCNAKCKDFVNIVYITRSDFLEVISSFPKDKEKFCMIKDKILFSNIPIKQSCNICHSIFHQIHSCPYVHYGKKKEYVISKSIYQLISKREPYEKRRNYKQNSLFKNEEVRYQLKNIRMQLLIMANGINTQEFQAKINEQDSILENCNLSLANYLENNKLTELINNQSKKNANKSQISNIADASGTKGEQQECPLECVEETEQLPECFTKFKVQKNQSQMNQKSDESDQICPEEIVSPVSIRKTNNSFKIDASIDQKGPQQIQTETSIMQNQSEVRTLGNEKEKQQMQVSSKKRIFYQISLNNEHKEKKQEQEKQIEEEINSYKQIKKQKKKQLIYFDKNKNPYKILPSQLESDKEFFQKYNTIRWQDNEIYVSDNEEDIIPSYSSFTQIDQDIEGNQSIGANLSIQTSAFKNKIYGQQLQYSDGQGYNLNIINEEINQEDLGDLETSILPFGLVKQRPNQSQLLNQILQKVDNIKAQQEQLRKEQQMKDQHIESKIRNTIQRTLTFSLKNIANVADDNQQSESSAKFLDIMSFGQRKTDEIEEVNEVEKIIKKIPRIQSEIQQPNMQQSNLIKFKDNQNNQILQSSQVNVEMKNTLKQDMAQIVQNVMQNSKQISFTSNQQKQFDQKEINNKLLDIQYQNKQAMQIYQEKKLKEKFELQFFLAFERQNNWKTYFPTQNLSYITQKIICKQKILENSQILYKNMNQKKSKFRRLSELVQQNKDKKASEKSSLKIKLQVPQPQKYKK
ncbi:cyclic nucleotide-binding domain protein (macronuclear) [Tetrahymena thermophila SB210]|uniref:Cyclic nucleotide-binding domain protein n=1 Tax=Tetrahymena thermophila (strain SB210) TaxID=312017 RepID=Q248D2_TETTS|nr:cyclic nucleotide-binding domain protein [Tetrahymena thermophila SB210]EAS04113.2 cyclic nucleotide-binding domain protein [Tetrahymena thermophila SB210]|eukprot:XP_001024358.2 cyclic nucleotide-binding domain protein [Tetrahymena thermophila SB210]